MIKEIICFLICLLSIFVFSLENKYSGFMLILTVFFSKVFFYDLKDFFAGVCVHIHTCICTCICACMSVPCVVRCYWRAEKGPWKDGLRLHGCWKCNSCPVESECEP